MGKKVSRLEFGERWWAAEIVLRSLGLALLGLCAAASLWLYRSIHLPPPHDLRVLDWADAVVIVLSWSAGGALLTVGPGLFKRIEVPARYARFPVIKGSDR